MTQRARRQRTVSAVAAAVAVALAACSRPPVATTSAAAAPPLEAPSAATAPPPATPDTAPPATTTSTTSAAVPPAVRPSTTTTTTAVVTQTASAAASSSAYTLNTNTDGSVVRWNPCTAIHWKVNLAQAPPSALADATTAVATLSAATGLTLVFDGTTTTTPTTTWLRSTADPDTIVIAWAPKATTDLYGTIADGEGGWREAGTSPDGVRWTWRIVRGFVLVDPTTTTSYAGGFGPGTTIGALLLHELGHAVGLAHVADQTQLMYPTLTSKTVARYSAGDLAGLTRVGRSAGCIAA